MFTYLCCLLLPLRDEEATTTQWSTRDYVLDPALIVVTKLKLHQQHQQMLMRLFSKGIFVGPLGSKK